jgi:hypothetical protein
VLEVRLEPRHKRAQCSQCGAARRRHHDLRGGERRWRALLMRALEEVEKEMAREKSVPPIVMPKIARRDDSLKLK